MYTFNLLVVVFIVFFCWYDTQQSIPHHAWYIVHTILVTIYVCTSTHPMHGLLRGPSWRSLTGRSSGRGMGCILSMHQKRNHPNVEKKLPHEAASCCFFLDLEEENQKLGQIVFFYWQFKWNFGKIAQHFRGRWPCFFTAASLVQTYAGFVKVFWG